MGRLRAQHNANGTSSSYTYDTAGRLDWLTHFAADGTTMAAFGYRYNAVGNITRIDLTGGAHKPYAYSALEQLTDKAKLTSSGVVECARQYR
jgi:YD repeat-containing protein